MIISNTLPVYLVVHEDIERLTKLVVSDMRNFFHKIILIFYRIRGSNSCSHTSPTLSNERVLPSRPFPLTPSLSPARCLFLSFRLPHPNFAHSVMGMCPIGGVNSLVHFSQCGSHSQPPSTSGHLPLCLKYQSCLKLVMLRMTFQFLLSEYMWTFYFVIPQTVSYINALGISLS